jgi:hypothetical protein
MKEVRCTQFGLNSRLELSLLNRSVVAPTGQKHRHFCCTGMNPQCPSSTGQEESEIGFRATPHCKKGAREKSASKAQTIALLTEFLLSALGVGIRKGTSMLGDDSRTKDLEETWCWFHHCTHEVMLELQLQIPRADLVEKLHCLGTTEGSSRLSKVLGDCWCLSIRLKRRGRTMK